MRFRRPLLPVAAAAAFLLASFTGIASAAAPAPKAPDYVKNAIAQQLARKPGGVVRNGDTVVYPGVEISYQPVDAIVPLIWGCTGGYVCLYANGDHTSIKLVTNSLWCPSVRGSQLSLADYGLYGNVRSADSENSWWVEAIWSAWWGEGPQWNMAPLHEVHDQSPDHVAYVQVCVRNIDLTFWGTT